MCVSFGFCICFDVMVVFTYVCICFSWEGSREALEGDACGFMDGQLGDFDNMRCDMVMCF